MRTLNQQKMERLIEQGYEFRLGDYISEGFSIMQKQMGLFVGFTIVFFLIVMGAQIVPVVGPIASSFFLSPPLVAGFYLVSHKIKLGEPITFNDFFSGFTFVGPLAIATIVLTIFYIVGMVPFIMAVGTSIFLGEFTGFEMFPFWSFFLLLPLVYLGVAYSWTSLFIVFHKMEFWPAMELSRKIVTKNWWQIFLFAIAIGFVNLAGVLALGVGLLFTVPASLAAQYAAFADVTRLMEEEEADEIVDHLVD